MLPLLVALWAATPLEDAFTRMQSDPKRETRYAFGHALLAEGLPSAAFAYLGELLHGPDDELKKKAIADLILLGKTLEDDYVIPHLISSSDFRGSDWATYKVAVLLLRRRDPKALSLLNAIESKSEYYGQAQYLLAVHEMKRERFDLVTSWAIDRREPELAQQAAIAVARILFAKGDMEESARAYRAVRLTDEVRMELAWALFQSGHFEQARAALSALDYDAWPEARVLLATIHFQVCRLERALAVAQAASGWQRREPFVQRLMSNERWRRARMSVDRADRDLERAKGLPDALQAEVSEKIRWWKRDREKIVQRLGDDVAKRVETFMQDFGQQARIIASESALGLADPEGPPVEGCSTRAPPLAGEVVRARLDRADAAIGELVKMLGDNALKPIAMEWLGDVSRRRGELDRALVAYEWVAATDLPVSNEDEALFRIVEIGDPDRAIKYATKLISRHPTSPLVARAQLHLGDAYFAKNMFKEANAAYTAALSSSPDEGEGAFARYSLAWCDFALGKKRDAAKKMNEVVSLAAKLKSPALETAAKEMIAASRAR